MTDSQASLHKISVCMCCIAHKITNVTSDYWFGEAIALVKLIHSFKLELESQCSIAGTF